MNSWRRIAPWTLAVLAGFGLAVGRPQQVAPPERHRLVFAPPNLGVYLLSYDMTEAIDYEGRRGSRHVVWTMRDRVATVTKRGRVLLDGSFVTVDYSSSHEVDGATSEDGFHWSDESGFGGGKGNAVESIGKVEIPKGLHLILDARGAAEHGEC